MPDGGFMEERPAKGKQSSREQFVFAPHQLPDFLERLVERSCRNMAFGGVDREAVAWIGIAQQIRPARKTFTNLIYGE